MSILVSERDCVIQSKGVFTQFGFDKWIPAAKKNALLPRKETNELRHIGVGRTLVACAMGASLEGEIDTLKKYRGRYDLITCDKGFKPLYENGLKADYVQLADTNVETRWMGGDDSEMWANTEGVKMICTPYANPEWTKRWKGPLYFYVNKDAIRSEGRFADIMPNVRVIPASTNVSNAMIVFMTGADEKAALNFAGYDQILLVGYDYSWRVGDNYYAFNDPKPKRFYMAQRDMLDIEGEAARTSGNLLFSAKWLYSYLSQHTYLPITNCSGRGLLDIKNTRKLREALEEISPDPKKRKAAKDAYEETKAAQKVLDSRKRKFKEAQEAIYGSRR